VESIKEQIQVIQNTFKNSMNMIPNGVLLINKVTKGIEFANNEILKITGANNSDLQEKVTEFLA